LSRPKLAGLLEAIHSKKQCNSANLAQTYRKPFKLV
jgi:hypothetical protein